MRFSNDMIGILISKTVYTLKIRIAGTYTKGLPVSERNMPRSGFMLTSHKDGLLLESCFHRVGIFNSLFFGSKT